MIEFVDDLPSFEYFRKITLTTSLRKARKGRDSGTSEEQHRSFRETGTSTIFSLGYQYCAWPCSAPFFWQKPFFDCTVELIWLLFLNILSFNFVPTPNRSLRFRRFRRNYVKPPCYCSKEPLSKLRWLFYFMCAFKSGNAHFFAAVCPQ